MQSWPDECSVARTGSLLFLLLMVGVHVHKERKFSHTERVSSPGGTSVQCSPVLNKSPAEGSGARPTLKFGSREKSGRLAM